MSEKTTVTPVRTEGDDGPLVYVHAIGKTLKLLKAVVALGLLIVGLLVWIGVEVTTARTQAHEDAVSIHGVLIRK